MEYHRFPGTELSVSKLCFGCWGITSDFHWGTRVEDESTRAMAAAVENGVNFFDTAPMYADGASEALLGKFLTENKLRDRVVVASKVRPDNMAPDQIVRECEESLMRLQTDYIDLYQTHWTSPDVPLEDSWGAMIRLQEQGKVRQIGVCNAGVGDLEIVLGKQPPLTNQLPYNLISRMIDHAIQPRCVEQGIGILVYSPLMHGLLAGKYSASADVPDRLARTRHFSSSRPHTRHQESGCEDATFEAIGKIRAMAEGLGCSMAELALSWLLAKPGVVSVIAGARNEDQLVQNVKCVAGTLDQQQIDELDQITDRVKDHLGSNATSGTTVKMPATTDPLQLSRRRWRQTV